MFQILGSDTTSSDNVGCVYNFLNQSLLFKCMRSDEITESSTLGLTNKTSKGFAVKRHWRELNTVCFIGANCILRVKQEPIKLTVMIQGVAENQQPLKKC